MSVVSVLVAQIALFILFGMAHWTAKSANILASLIGGVPSYYLNRRWVWGRSGRSHLWKEVAPFWAIALLGLAFSTWAADFAETKAIEITDSRTVQALIVNFGAFAAYGVLWVGKYVFFNRVLFTHRPVADGEPATGG